MTFHMAEPSPTTSDLIAQGLDLARAQREAGELRRRLLDLEYAADDYARLLAALDVILDAPRTGRRSKHAEQQVQAVRELVDRERAR